MNDKDLFHEFLQGLFHRFNNFLGPCYGKLDLILLFDKPEYRSMLKPEEVTHLWDGWSELTSWRSKTDHANRLLAEIQAGKPPMVKELLCDSVGRCLKALNACPNDANLSTRINRFVTDMSASLPLPSPLADWMPPQGIQFAKIHQELQTLVSAIRAQENRFLNI